jgi:hypothetical protein
MNMAIGTGLNLTNSNAPGAVSVGGIMPIISNSQLERNEEERKKAAEQANNAPVIQGLAHHIRKCWTSARTAKQMTVEQRMLQSIRQRRGEYDPQKLAMIQQQGGAEIYMMLTANKCRSASSWLRDVLLTTTSNKPWSIQPGAVPDLSPDIVQSVMQDATQQIQQLEASGTQLSQSDIRQMLLNLKDQATARLQQIARAASDRMEAKMQDQLQEGGFLDAMSDVIDDITTFPTAILKGPVVRKKSVLKWVPGPNGTYTPDVKEDMVLEWERVDPFNAYPAADATKIDDGYFIERHRLSRSDLSELIGVDGYSDDAISAVLDEYGRGGLHDWIQVDMEKASVEGKSTSAVGENPSELIDALQFWGNVQGKMLIEWGLDKKSVPDPLKEYPVEVWLVGNWVIKAVVNSDPMGRKPYYKASYEEIPGCFWGNSVADLCRDTQDVCNAAARALVNNMGIASGPQVVYNVDRLPQGENITQMYPWKTWQVTSDPMAGSQPMMQFFQPQSLSQELMGVYEKFATLADEYTGIPRYMTGDSPTGGAGRTASGMSMLMSNAGKSIKQVISSMDTHILAKAIDRLYYYNMKYSEDPDLKGDVNIIANGAEALMAQEQTQQRRNEFLQLVLQNPIAHQVVGMEGIAAIIRENAKNLGMDVNEIVPPIEILKQQWAQQQQAQQQVMGQQGSIQGGPPQQPGVSAPGGTPPAMNGPGAQLQNGAPVTNNFTPMQK